MTENDLTPVLFWCTEQKKYMVRLEVSTARARLLAKSGMLHPNDSSKIMELVNKAAEYNSALPVTAQSRWDRG